MPASPRSPRLTDSYRARLLALRDQAQAQARIAWPAIEALDATDWPERVASTLTVAQTGAARLSVGYLTAYVRSEGVPGTAPAIDSREYAGKSRDGRPLAEALRSPLIGTYAALKEGRSSSEALTIGLNRGTRMVEEAFMQAARQSLLDVIQRDERVEGWQRAVNGTCGACLGDVAVQVSVQLPSIPLRVHPNCLCVTQPVVVGVPDRVPMLTGVERFTRMSREEQDEEFGPEKADALRAEPARLSQLVDESPQATGEDFITEAPAAALSTP